MFTLTATHQKRLRTTNTLERVNQELKRCTRVARVFPNKKSLPRLITARLSETSDDWETGKFTSPSKTKPRPQFDAQRISAAR